MPTSLPETVLQFGGGRFLRSFVDRFIHDANEAGQAFGRVVVVQSTPGARASLLNSRPDGYPLLVRGVENGEIVDRVDCIASVSRGLEAATQWDAVLEFARSPDLKLIVSNTTESGYALSPDDALDASPPASFPAKLTRVLWERFRAKQSAPLILPCELFERNAERLRELVTTLARQWSLPADFLVWLERDCVWLNNLVDCIVTAPPPDHPLAPSEPLLNVREPFALLAVQRPAGKTVALFEHPDVHLVDDVGPYHLRKVRMLNGAHTAMVAKFKPLGFETVQQVMADAAASRWVRDVLFEEIVPTLAYRADGVALFADQTWDRFRNPFLNHRLADIAAHHADKVKIRLVPTIDEYQKLFGKPPRRLTEALASGGAIMIRSAVTVSLVPEVRGGPFVFWDDLPSAAAKAKAFGFDAIEVFPPSGDAVDPKLLRRILDDNGLSLAAVGTGAGWVKHRLHLCLPDAGLRAKARAFIKNIIEFAGPLGAPTIMGSMQGRYEGAIDASTARGYLLDALDDLGTHAAQYRVPLLYEPLNRYETNMATTLAAGVDLLKSLKGANVKLLADLFHMNIEETDSAAALRATAGFVGHIHFVDSNRRPAGLGHIDYVPIAAALSDIRYDGYLSAEAFPYPDPDAAAQQTIAMFRQFFC